MGGLAPVPIYVRGGGFKSGCGLTLVSWHLLDHCFEIAVVLIYLVLVTKIAQLHFGNGFHDSMESIESRNPNCKTVGTRRETTKYITS